MTATLALAVLMTVSPMGAEPTSGYVSGTCSAHTWKHVPSSIRVYRSQSRRVDRVPFRLYVQRVLASGAFPAWLPIESIKVGAIAVAQYARWEMEHDQERTRSGRCYDIRDGGEGQYYRSDVRIHSKIRRAVDAVWGVLIWKNDRYIRTGWRGNAGRDGWHIFEQSVTARARQGWHWRRLVRWQLSPNLRIIES